MSSHIKWLAVHLNPGVGSAKLEREIVLEFERAYTNANKPKGMGLFSFTPIGGHGLYMTPQSIPYCDSLLRLVRWSESNPLPNGPCGWLAGDESLK
jgi:hypothetical protein